LRVNVPLEYSIRRVKVKEDGLKLNCTHQRLIYADNVNILGCIVHIIKIKAATLVFANKENGLEVNADQTKYMVISRDQRAGRIHNIKMNNSAFEGLRVKKFEETTGESQFYSGRN
jgi:hypothetical protein